MSNTIRKRFEKEVEDLLPILHETYRQIGWYQKRRDARNQEKVWAQLDVIGEKLLFFKPFIQSKKRAYFDAILNRSLSVSDRIIALDIAVGAMHIEFAVPRAYMHRESEALRRVLELSRRAESDRWAKSVDDSDGVLVKGIAASPGVVTGKSTLVRKHSDYKRLSAGSIVIAKMTRPEMVIGADKIAGIVTDAGGSLCHAAIIARELRIPCVVGTGNATQRIKQKWLIAVDGNHGTVKKVRRGER